MFFYLNYYYARIKLMNKKNSSAKGATFDSGSSWTSQNHSTGEAGKDHSGSTESQNHSEMEGNHKDNECNT